MKKSLLLSFVLLGVLSLGLTGSADSGLKKDASEFSAEIERPSNTSIEMRIDDLTHQIDLWHDAILKGDISKSNFFEQDILKTLKIDLDETKNVVRYFATKTTLKDNDKSKSKDEKSVDKDSEAFQSSLSIFNSKEQVSLSFARTNAFSNKYRLISDYVDLLRKQLDMPRIKLAFEQSNQKRIPSN